MGKEREPLFAREDVLPPAADIDDLSEFGTKPRPRVPDTARPTIRALAEDAGFRSREPRSGQMRPVRSSHITGRNAQINLKARPETIDTFSAIADEHDWSKALTFERAVAALRRLLAEGADPQSLDLEP